MADNDPGIEDEELELMLDNDEAAREAALVSYQVAKKLGLDDVADEIAKAL